MFRKNFFKLLASIAVFALAFSQFSNALAAKISFGGEPEDNFWDIDTLFCRDGFSVTAQQTTLDVEHKEFWLELGSSSIPVTVQTGDDSSARIAHGDGSSLVNGTADFFFVQLQNVDTPVDIVIERWDHGNMTAHEVNADGSDESPSDDIKHVTENNDGVTIPLVEDCLIDTVAPSISITNPQAQDYLQNTSAPASWEVSDDLSGIASSSAELDGNPISNGQTLDLFFLSPGPHTLTVNATDNSGNPAQASVTFNVVVTIESLIDTTSRACSMNWISKKGTCKELLEILREAKKGSAHGHESEVREKLKEYLRKLQTQKGKSVNQSAYDLLAADAKYLLNQLPPPKDDDHGDDNHHHYNLKK